MRKGTFKRIIASIGLIMATLGVAIGLMTEWQNVASLCFASSGVAVMIVSRYI